MTLHSRPPAGLDGVVAAATALSHVDGAEGRLIIAGAQVDDLAGQLSFEGLTARLWSLASGSPIGEATVRHSLGVARARTFERLPAILAAAEGLPVVAGVRAGVAALGPVGGLPDEAVLVGAMPVIAAA
ncbi:citrate synthase/methylcitrate synthase, partial [Aquibium carbonis]